MAFPQRAKRKREAGDKSVQLRIHDADQRPEKMRKVAAAAGDRAPKQAPAAPLAVPVRHQAQAPAARQIYHGMYKEGEQKRISGPSEVLGRGMTYDHDGDRVTVTGTADHQQYADGTLVFKYLVRFNKGFEHVQLHQSADYPQAFAWVHENNLRDLPESRWVIRSKNDFGAVKDFAQTVGNATNPHDANWVTIADQQMLFVFDSNTSTGTHAWRKKLQQRRAFYRGYVFHPTHQEVVRVWGVRKALEKKQQMESERIKVGYDALKVFNVAYKRAVLRGAKPGSHEGPSSRIFAGDAAVDYFLQRMHAEEPRAQLLRRLHIDEEEEDAARRHAGADQPTAPVNYLSVYDNGARELMKMALQSVIDADGGVGIYQQITRQRGRHGEVRRKPRMYMFMDYESSDEGARNAVAQRFDYLPMRRKRDEEEADKAVRRAKDAWQKEQKAARDAVGLPWLHEENERRRAAAEERLAARSKQEEDNNKERLAKLHAEEEERRRAVKARRQEAALADDSESEWFGDSDSDSEWF